MTAEGAQAQREDRTGVRPTREEALESHQVPGPSVLPRRKNSIWNWEAKIPSWCHRVTGLGRGFPRHLMVRASVFSSVKGMGGSVLPLGPRGAAGTGFHTPKLPFPGWFTGKSSSGLSPPLPQFPLQLQVARFWEDQPHSCLFFEAKNMFPVAQFSSVPTLPGKGGVPGAEWKWICSWGQVGWGLGRACSQVALGPWIAPHWSPIAFYSGLKPGQSQEASPLQTCSRLERHGPRKESSFRG